MKINGAETVVRDRGGTGSPVLLIHGTLSRDFLNPLADELSSTYRMRAITYDRRMFGNNVVEPYSLEQHASDAVEVLNALRISKAHVYGHSTGAMIAMQLAKQAPNRIISLHVGEADLPTVLVPVLGKENEEGYNALREMYRTAPAKDVFDAMFVGIVGPTYREIVPANILDQAFNALAIWFESEYPATLDWKITADDIKKFPMPIQNIYGADTLPYFKEVCRVMKQLNPRIENVEIPGPASTHFIPFTHVKLVAKAIADFSQRAIR